MTTPELLDSSLARRVADMTSPTRVDRDRVAALLLAGHSAADTARRLGCATRTIERIRRDELDISVQHPQRRFSWDELAAIELMLADGASIAEALLSVGRNPKCYHARFRGRGWTHTQRAEYAAARKAARRAGIEI